MQWLSISLGGLWVAAIPPGARPFANLGQPNQRAILLVLTLVSAARAHECKAIGHLAMRSNV